MKKARSFLQKKREFLCGRSNCRFRGTTLPADGNESKAHGAGMANWEY